jgi:hypothetical protein
MGWTLELKFQAGVRNVSLFHSGRGVKLTAHLHLEVAYFNFAVCLHGVVLD